MSIVKSNAESQRALNWAYALMADAVRGGYFTSNHAGTKARKSWRRRVAAWLAEAKFRVQQAWSYLRHGYAHWQD